jgi:tRNA(Ile2) C34 agmatinyltransferase TiaS
LLALEVVREKTWISRTREVVRQTLRTHGEPELDRLLVAGAIVAREGSHYRIETGGESWEEIEAIARRESGVCDCGKPLSARGKIYRCRTCGREFRLT